MPMDNGTATAAPVDDLALELSDASSGTTQETHSPAIPDKYQGKSLEDIINMHQNAERRLSQQGQELGEVRRLADQLIGVRATDNAKKPEARQPITVEKLLENPEQVLTGALESSPVAQRTKGLEDRLNNIELSTAQQNFSRTYPSFQQDMENPVFHDWVKKNAYRQGLANAAYHQDYNAANALWSMWEETKDTSTTAANAASRNRTVQNAKTQKGGSSEAAPAKTYSRAKLMELRAKVADGDQSAAARWNDEEFQAGLIRAYAEGRVK